LRQQGISALASENGVGNHTDGNGEGTYDSSVQTKKEVLLNNG